MKRKTRKKRSTREKQAQSQKRKKTVLIAVMCVVLVCVGYIGTDAFMIRHSYPVRQSEEITGENADSNTEKKKIKSIALGIPSVALDNSVMLSSVLEEAKDSGFKSVSFELKRADGSIGYDSSLTTVDTFGAISMPAKQLHESIKTMKGEEIKPIAVIYCLKDNIVPSKSKDMAVIKDNKIYKDYKGNTYLNPDSEDALKYLKEIVIESYNLGVRTFVLASVKLPDNVRKEHKDGFKKLSAELSSKVGSDAVFIEAVEAEINGWNVADGEYNYAGIKNEIEKLPKLKSNQMYLIKTEKDIDTINKALNKNKIKGYIIKEK